MDKQTMQVGKSGIVSRSGFGDGGYECFVQRHNGEGDVVAARIVFISEEDEDYE